MPRYHKEVREVIRYAESRGWVLEGMGRSGHVKLRHPNGAMVTMSATPSSRSFRYAAKGSIRQAERSVDERSAS